ncbi:MAG TPA: polysaccharide deacetylase family protein [Desulfobacteria bacterium]|nr:polysaccharide deacetylase family protein [Desulfobacteria bacterium]
MIWQYLLILGVVFVMMYTVVPDLLLHRFGIGSWKRQYSSGVALTFDDGPNPDITPQILDLLAKYHIRATFFLVGERALKYPELVKQILAKGHKIGSHSQYHRYAWLTSPLKTWRGWEEGVANLEAITGEQIEIVRPPWGTFNLATWLWLIWRKKRAVLWNAEGHDWLATRTPAAISDQIVGQAREGTIIVLHDAGGQTGAPLNTLQALEIMCARIVEGKKLPIVPLEFPDWAIWRRLLFRAWEKWEGLFARLNKVDHINATNMLRLSKSIYKGPDIYAPDGSLLARTGDFVGEIHIDSGRLLRNHSNERKRALLALKLAKQSLPELARYVVTTPKYHGIKVFLGLSLLSRGMSGLGFTIEDLPDTLSNRVVGLIQTMIMRVYNPTGKTKIDRRPKLVWISREQLLAKWLTAEEAENPGNSGR